MNRERFNSDLRDVNYAGRRAAPSALAWTVAGIVVLLLLGGGIFALKVALSGPKGAGEQIRITNDGRNRVNAQEWFAGQYEQIRSTDARIDVAAKAMAVDPKDEIAKTNYFGLINRCEEMVGNYNAEANKVSRGKWLDSAVYPFQIDKTDASTDCKETSK